MDAVERLSLEDIDEPTLIALTHIHRYRFAGGLCADRRVLDLCCGSGYGSRLLAETAAHVRGVDIDGPSIERANAEAADDSRLSFACEDALDLLSRPLAGEFDVVVLYEGLEHLANLELAVERLRAQVDSGVSLIISLPNSRQWPGENPHHTTEFDYELATETLTRIGVESVLMQFQAEGSLIRTAEDGPLEGSSTLAERAEPEHCNHLIGLANLGHSSDSLSSARMQVSVAPAFNTYMLDLERANRRLWRTNLRLSRQRLGIADSAAAASLERLRTEDEQRRDEPPPQPQPGPLARLGAGLKRAIALILPHGVIVWYAGLKAPEPEPEQDSEQS